MSRKQIDNDYKRVTIHPAVSELTLDVLRTIADDKDSIFTRIVDELLQESETFNKYKKIIREKGFSKDYSK